MFKIKRTGLYYYYLPTFLRIMIVTALVIGNQSWISAAVVIGLIFLGGLYVAILLPFADNQHNFRSIYNSICSIIVFFTIFLVRMNVLNTTSIFYFKLPYLIIGILFTVIGMSMAFIIKKFY